MQNFKQKLYDFELNEISQSMQSAGYSDDFTFYICTHFQLLFEDAYVYGTTALKQLGYYVAINTITYNAEQSKSALLDHYNDIKVFLDNNSDYNKYCDLFFKDVEKFEVLIIKKLFDDYALKYDYTDAELEKINK
jgi:hypothetical protein